VVFYCLQWGCGSEGDAERINPYAFYEVGKSFRQVEAFDGDVALNAVLWPLLQCQSAIANLIEGKPIPLGISRAKASELQTQIQSFMESFFHEDGPDGKRNFKFPKDTDPPIPGWQWSWLKKALADFETVFAEEMRETASYFVPRRGIYWTPALVDAADQTFPSNLLGHIPQKTREDWKAAGRCLAFNLLSASGFHVARAVEGTLEAYYQLFSGKPGETLNNWHDYKKALDVIVAKGPTPAPLAKTISELDQMRTDYRNPIVHPRVVLTEADARMLFANGESLIIAMAQEIAEAKAHGSVQLALAERKMPDGAEERQAG
jgi:hypothetical protein